MIVEGSFHTSWQVETSDNFLPSENTSSKIFVLTSLSHYDIHYSKINTDKEYSLCLYLFLVCDLFLKQSQILTKMLFIKALYVLSFFIFVGRNSERFVNESFCKQLAADFWIMKEDIGVCALLHYCCFFQFFIQIVKVIYFWCYLKSTVSSDYLTTPPEAAVPPNKQNKPRRRQEYFLENCNFLF